jgi:hypothetical protein
MKRFGWILVLLIMVAPAWSANKKITVGQLEDLLHSLHQANKTDADVAAELKQVDLTEELTRSTMNSLVSFVPGPLSTEQIYVLEALSSMLPPPAADIPTTPAPDAAAQKAILDKANDYAAKTYAQLPALTATKTTLRFQDSMDVVRSSSGMHSSASEADTSFGVGATNNAYIRYINSTETPVESVNGAEKFSSGKDQTKWGPNGMIALQEPGPVLSTVLQEAETAEKINWLRWETVNGKQAAVFSFAVDKKKSRYGVNYCCFPDTDQSGLLNYSMAGGKGAAPGNTNATAKGNLQTNTNFKNFKGTEPYHGELFIDPDTGIVVRLITEVDFKPSDVVHQEDDRIDYGPVTVGGKALILPIKSIITTEVVPNGEDSAGKYSIRRTLFTAEYKDYQPAGAAR